MKESVRQYAEMVFVVVTAIEKRSPKTIVVYIAQDSTNLATIKNVY